jgi:hypothetical protein
MQKLAKRLEALLHLVSEDFRRDMGTAMGTRLTVQGWDGLGLSRGRRLHPAEARPTVPQR